ncbi:nSTAND1 domain-containing NTPase [Sphingobium xenophagum]|uniref:nSTAND1 domain-containing NTPase n=1 Tax=Sphingobium xenophagum TaxID=121428 RepID=UPI00037F9817|nr:AAA family ATPase [Sphingobium xenophagum]
MSSVTHQPYCASLLLAGPAGGEVCKVLGLRVAFDPPVLERELVKVDRAPVNSVHNGELGLSAKRAGTVALQLLFREINHNHPVQRLWIDIDPPSLQVTGRSAELLFGLVAYLHLGAPSLPKGVPDSDFMATGLLDPDGNVGSVEAVAVKVRAALASGPKVGTRLFYPRADEAQIGDDLRAECRRNGLILCPVDRIDEALDALGVPILGSWPSGISPFRALEAYDTRFSRVFFGRQREVEALTSLLEARAAAGRSGALIIGASGAGKSSFCLAGVLAALIKRKPGLQYAVWRPRDAASGLGDEPADEQRLAQSILSQWQVRDEKQLGMTLAAAPEGAPMLQDLPACFATEAGQRSVFVIDQFEELFTLNFTPRARIGLARLLQSLQARGIWVIGTLRSEFYASYLELADEDGQVILTPLFEGDGQYNLPRMSRDAFSQVITRPAELAGLQFEQRANGVSLAQTLLADAMATDDALPLLGFALQKLYDSRELPEAGDLADATFPRTLGFAAYVKLGGLAGAIGTVAADAYSALDSEAQAELPGLLDALAVPSADGTRETARPAPIDQWPLGTPGRRLIDALTTIRVLVSEQGTTPDAPAVVRVAHEALFSHWEQAAKLLNDSRQNRLLIEEFRQKAKVWDDEDHPRDRLLTSPRDIVNANAIRALVPVVARNAVLTAFLDASASRVRRQRNVRYLSAATIAVVLAGSTGWALFERDRAKVSQRFAEAKATEAKEEALAAISARNSARDQTKIANQARMLAQAAAVSEAKQRAEALRQRDLALTATRLATRQQQRAEAQTAEARRQRSRAVAQLAGQAVEQGDAMTGLLLARSQLDPADEASWTGAAQTALLQAYLGNREIMALRLGDGEHIGQIKALSPDRRRAVVAHEDGTTLIWTFDAATPSSIALPQLGRGAQTAEFSDDGQKLVTVSREHGAVLWDLGSNQLLATPLEGTRGKALFGSFSRYGQHVITSGHDRTAQIWTINGKLKSTIGSEGGPNAIAWATLSSDGRFAVTLSGANAAHLWKLDADRPVPILLPGRYSIFSEVALSPDGRQLVITSDDHTVDIWNLYADHLTPIILTGHTDKVNSVAFSPDGSRIATGSDDRTARIWNTSGDMSAVAVLKGHSRFVTHVTFSPDGERVVTGSGDGTARIWTLGEERPASIVLAGHQDPVEAAEFSQDGRFVTTFTLYGTVRRWDATPANSNGIVLAGHTRGLTSAAFSPDGRSVVTTSNDKTARVWQLTDSGRMSIPLIGHSQRVTQARFSPDSRRIVTASYDGTARIWNLASDQAASVPLSGHKEALVSAEFSPDGRHILTASRDGEARIWTAASDRLEFKSFKGPDRYLKSARLSQDGKRLFATFAQGIACVWSIDSNASPSIFPKKHALSIDDARVSPDGRFMATASQDGTARVWRIDNGSVDYVPLIGHDWVTDVIFSPDGLRVVTLYVDGTARIWDHTVWPLRSVLLSGHSHSINSAEFSPDGKRLVTASADGTARIWTVDRDIATAATLSGHSGEVVSASFSPEGRRIVTASSDGTARVWDVPDTRQLLPLVDAVITRCLTLQQRELAGLDPSDEQRTSGPATGSCVDRSTVPQTRQH